MRFRDHYLALPNFPFRKPLGQIWPAFLSMSCLADVPRGAYMLSQMATSHFLSGVKAGFRQSNVEILSSFWHCHYCSSKFLKFFLAFILLGLYYELNNTMTDSFQELIHLSPLASPAIINFTFMSCKHLDMSVCTCTHCPLYCENFPTNINSQSDGPVPRTSMQRHGLAHGHTLTSLGPVTSSKLVFTVHWLKNSVFYTWIKLL